VSPVRLLDSIRAERQCPRIEGDLAQPAQPATSSVATITINHQSKNCIVY
jgi:hypothetical protein